MPLPPANLSPPFNIVRLSHAELAVTDLGWSRAYYVDLLGLRVTHADKDAIYLRAMEERGHHSLILRRASDPSARVLGFKVWSEADLDLAHDWFGAQGLPVAWTVRPFMGRVLRTSDPWGVPLEFYSRMERLPPIHQDYRQYGGVKPLRIDHFNLFSADVDAAVAFYGTMGFRVTEYTEDDASGRLWAAWMHRKGGVHDIAFTNGTGPRLHHVAFWVPTPLNIIDLLDLMATTGYLSNIERGPGRHGISNAFFLYIRDRDGHRTEIYCSDYQTVDPDHEPIRWDLTDPRRQTLWGAPAPKSWFELGTTFHGVTLRDSDLKSQPIVAP
jgi:catechol 2,3-dioxygenase